MTERGLFLSPRILTAADRPGERALQPVVAPEQLAVGSHKARGAEDAVRLRGLRFCAQPRLDRLGLGPCQYRRGVDAEWHEQSRHGGAIVDPAALAEFGPEHRAAEIPAPALRETDQRHAR